jgi:hypothetical protein
MVTFLKRLQRFPEFFIVIIDGALRIAITYAVEG